MRWQYREAVRIDGDAWIYDGAPINFDALGADGWELVSVYALARPGFDIYEFAFLKRRIDDGTQFTNQTREGGTTAGQ